MKIKKTKFLKGAALSALMYAGAAPAEMSVMYGDWSAALIKPGVEAYEAATGEKVKLIEMPSAGYVERLSLDLSSGTAADVLLVDSYVVAEFASSGYLAPLGGMASNWDQYPQYMKGLLDVVSYDGDPHALPTDTDVRMLWYNKAAFKKAGIAMPWQPKSWDDVIATAKTLKDKAGLENAFVIPAGTKRGEATTMQGFYMALLGADSPEGGRNRLRDWDEGQWIGDSPAIRRTLELFKTIYVDDKLAAKSINYNADPDAVIRKGMRDGTIGILASGSWENACIWDCSGTNLPSQEERDAIVGWAPFPGSGVAGAPATTNISGGWALSVNNAAADKETAFKLMTYIFDKERFKDWTVARNAMAVRYDIASDPAYTTNSFSAKATPLAETTTGRDTYPGYQTVSTLVQKMTEDILDGSSVDEAVQNYKDGLVDEFGEESVKTYK